MEQSLRRSLDDIEAHAKAHPAAAAGVGAAAIAGALLLGRKHGKAAANAQAGSGATQANTGTLYSDPGADSGYVPPTGSGYPSSGVYTQIMGPPGPAGATGATGATGAIGATGATGAKGADASPAPHVPPTPAPKPKPPAWSAPAAVVAKYKCPPGYSFGPEKGNTGNVVCHPNTGKGSDISVRPK